MDNNEQDIKGKQLLSEAELNEVNGGVLRKSVFYCSICRKKFYNDSGYVGHLRQVHQIG